jgi:ribosomal protein L11 methyltransferase
MISTSFTAPRELANTLLALTEDLPELSLDVGEVAADGNAYAYTWWLPEGLQATFTQLVAPWVNAPLVWQAVDTTVDYVAATRANFPPLLIGPFFIARNEETAPADKLGLQISPNRAFGSGEHATTTGCVLAYLELWQRGWRGQRVLDFGAGSGILALAAARHSAAADAPIGQLLCIDNDPPSVEICDENVQMNGMAGRIVSQVGEVPPADTFELVFANILLQPLVELAAPLAGCVAESAGAALVLSGFTTDQADTIAAAYAAQGLRPTWQHEQAGWLAQIWQR